MITIDKMHKNKCLANWKTIWAVTSIADIILYPQESIVSFHLGKPSGMTGSEFSSYKGRHHDRQKQ